MTVISSMGVFGQTAATPDTTQATDHFMTSIHAGTVGFGLDFKYNHGQHSVRLGYSTIPFHYATTLDVGLKMGTDLQVSYNNLHLLYDFQPFKNTAWFRLNAGVSYFISAQEKVKLTPQDAITTSIVTLTAEEIGNMEVTVDSKGFAPYLGFGLGRFVPKNKFNVNFDFGTYLLPSPTVTVVGTKLLSSNQALGTQLTEDLKTYRWMPVLQLNFTYLIK